MRIAGLAALAVAASAAPALATDWRLAGESDRAVSYIDMASVAHSGDGARFSRLMVLARALPGGGDTIRDSFAADCRARSYTMTKVEFFKGERPAGGLAQSAAGTAEAGTVLASLIDIACGVRKPDGEAIIDPYAAGRARLADAGAR